MLKLDPTRLMAVLSDIGDQRAAGAAQRKPGTCDPLTGIADRSSFFETAEHDIALGRHAPHALSLILFDADHFKQVNDRHGHPAGDAVLCHLAALMTRTFRQVDLVARVGGEEFAVLLPSTGADLALEAANRLRLALAAQPVMVDGVPIRLTVSGGVATLDDGLCDDGGLSGLDSMIKRADQALYAAKVTGRNRVVRWLPT
jgi:diguanylate cyclase (GGDEF)-like protein